MFKNCIEWRKREGVDTIIQDFEYPEKEEVLKIYPHSYHGTDKLSRPIYIERLGMLNLNELLKITSEKDLIRSHIYSYEVLLKLRFPACSLAAGKRIS